MPPGKPAPPYSDVLTRESERRLKAIVGQLPTPVAIIGGHGVRLRTSPAWKRQFNEEYFGSRDIDLLYRVEKEWTEREFRESAAAACGQRIRDAGFKPAGVFRFELYLDNDGKELAEAPQPPKQAGLDFQILSLDPMVGYPHPLRKKVMGFEAAEETILAEVFTDKGQGTRLKGWRNVILPTAPALIASKLYWLPQRTKDDKRRKDLCDIYALAQYGGSTAKDIRTIVHHRLPDARKLVDTCVTHSELEAACNHLAIRPAEFRAVVGPLALRP